MKIISKNLGDTKCCGAYPQRVTYKTVNHDCCSEALFDIGTCPISTPFLWENSALLDNGVITVSSEHDQNLTKEKITDGKPYTFWVSKTDSPSWMNYTLNTVQTVTKVTVGVRPG